MNPLRAVKIGIWVYFLLIIFEGAMRKWIFPQWSDALFVVRDPVVLVVYLFAWRAGIFPRRPAMAVIWLLVVASIAFSLAGEGSALVTMFGVRTNYLHLPLIFVMEAALTRDDVLRFGRWLMILAVPIVGLMWLQFESKPADWINVGAGGVTDGQILGAMGHVRAPGPFSFITGVVAYMSLTAAMVAHLWKQRAGSSIFLLLAATVAVTIAVPISISRLMLISLAAVVAFGCVAAVRDLRRYSPFFAVIIVAITAVLSASETQYVEAFSARWDVAMQASGGSFSTSIVDRIAHEFFEPFQAAVPTPLLGHGIGLGTVAGARLTSGKYSFLLAESELGRIVGELGPVLGFVFIAWRAWLTGMLLFQSWKRLRINGDTLPWLLAGATFMWVLDGQWGPSTQLGFSVFGAGLVLAALNEPAAIGEPTPDVDSSEDPDRDGAPTE